MTAKTKSATLTGGDGATLTGDDGAILIWTWFDDGRRRHITAVVGENGIKPNTKYTINGKGEIIEVSK